MQRIWPVANSYTNFTARVGLLYCIELFATICVFVVPRDAFMYFHGRGESRDELEATPRSHVVPFLACLLNFYLRT